MPLKISLKPHEKILIGSALLTNGEHAAHFTVENNVPILRRKDILTEAEAKTPCTKFYFLIQLMYFEPDNLKTHHELFWTMAKQLVKAAPSTALLVDEIGEHVVRNQFYPALKTARKLIAHEAHLLRHA